MIKGTNNLTGKWSKNMKTKYAEGIWKTNKHSKSLNFTSNQDNVNQNEILSPIRLGKF